MNAIEQGEYNPTIKLFRSICRVLGKRKKCVPLMTAWMGGKYENMVLRERKLQDIWVLRCIETIHKYGYLW